MRAVLVSLGLLLGAGPALALPYGPDTCKTGFVWREAYASDHVCVLPPIREQARRDNAAAAANVQPGGGPYGGGTCKPGLVWREAVPTDHVCVAPGTRAQAKGDNYYAYSRQQARVAGPFPRPGKSAGASTSGDGTVGGFHSDGGGVAVCAERFMCPPEMKMSVDENSHVCVCGRQ